MELMKQELTPEAVIERGKMLGMLFPWKIKFSPLPWKHTVRGPRRPPVLWKNCSVVFAGRSHPH